MVITTAGKRPTAAAAVSCSLTSSYGGSRILALQVEDAGGLSCRVSASQHRIVTLPHGILLEVAPWASDHPSRSNPEDFYHCEVMHPAPDTRFKTASIEQTTEARGTLSAFPVTEIPT